MSDTTKIQPTILVKKADGTSERISLAEFRLRKQGKPEIKTEKKIEDQRLKIEDQRVEKPQSSQSVRRVIPLIEESENEGTKSKEQKAIRRVIPLVEEIEVKKTSVPMVQGESRVTTTTPVTRVFDHQLPITNYQSPTDTRSLLDDDHGEIKVLAEKHNITHAPVTSVAFSSSVVIPKDLEARTTSLILSWKKGIRDKHQFLDYAIRGTADGGLGLTQINAEKLFAEISGNAVLGTPTAPSRPVSRPIVVRSGMSASITPKKSALQQIPNSTSLIREIAPTHDTSSVMGPTEEAGALTLEDFRRLSRVPKTAGEMLLAKFKGWKDESYLLYLQVRDSWKQSPLFRLYIEKTTEALEKNVVVPTVLEGIGLTYEEYIAIAEVSHQLSMMD